MSNVQPLLTRSEAAGMLRISVKTLDRLRKEGAIDALKIRSRVLFRPEAVTAFINRRSTCSSTRSL